MFDVINPDTGAKIRSLQDDDEASIALKAARARAAQPTWAARPLDERLGAIRRFRGLIVNRREALAGTLTDEVGKPITQSRNELDGLLRRLDFFLDKAAATLAPEEVHREPGLVERISREPLGLVANISAWNYPYFVGSNVFVPALLAGNSVLYKPSEFASLTGLALAALLHEAGVPEHAFVTVLGEGKLARPCCASAWTGSFSRVPMPPA